MPQLGATYLPTGIDDWSMPPVVSPSPQRVTPQVPQSIQDDVQRMELEACHVDASKLSSAVGVNECRPDMPSRNLSLASMVSSLRTTTLSDSAASIADVKASIITTDASAVGPGFEPPSFSPFPKVKGENIPPSYDDVSVALWNRRSHVLQSNNILVQLSWARAVLAWVEVQMEASTREHAFSSLPGKARPPTPKVEYEMRSDAVNIVNYLAQQCHPDALFITGKWLEFGKFGNRPDKKEAYARYSRAAEMGSGRAEYRMGMLFEQANDMAKAREHYLRGMAKNDSAASYRLGMISLLGQHGERQDLLRGLQHIRESTDTADDDAPQGPYVYGMLMVRDLGDISVPEELLPFNPVLARGYIERAALLGFAKAQLKMGQAYERCQLGCDLQPDLSLHYYGLAARQGVPEAALGVSRWFLFGQEGGFAKNEQLAYTHARAAALAGLPTGEFALGYYHEIGIYVNKDLTEARSWYQRAAEHGNQDAFERLESLHHHNVLSKQDHETTTLARVRSQIGSQRVRRPDKARQLQQLQWQYQQAEHSSVSRPTLFEGERGGPGKDDDILGANPNARHSVAYDPLLPQPLQPVKLAHMASALNPSPRHSPQPSPRHSTQPSPQPDHYQLSAVGQPPRNVPMRPQSVAPYPHDEGVPSPRPHLRNRAASTAPYPNDDLMRPASGRASFNPTGRGRGNALASPYAGSGIRHSQSATNLAPCTASCPPDDGRNSPTAWESRSRPCSDQRYHNLSPPPVQARPQSAMMGRDYGPRSSSFGMPKEARHSSYGPTNRLQHEQQLWRIDEGLHRLPHASTSPFVSAQAHTHLQAQAPTQAQIQAQAQARAHARAHAHAQVQVQVEAKSERGSEAGADAEAQPPTDVQPQVQVQSPPLKPSQGPATFEEMGIPHGKNESDCTVM